MAEIYSITTEEERRTLSELAKEVPDNGLIVEIGCLYGGTTASLALSNPNAKVISIDNFSWTPDGFPKASESLAIENLQNAGAVNVSIMNMTSQEAFAGWDSKIDLLWIDGGHDFRSVYFDLFNYSRFAKVVALHDFDNPLWPDIRQAVEALLSRGDGWFVDEVSGMVVVLRRSK